MIKAGVHCIARSIGHLRERLHHKYPRGNRSVEEMANQLHALMDDLHQVQEIADTLSTQCQLTIGSSLPNLRDIIEYCHEVLKNGQAINQLAKNRIQVETSLMAILESKRSIQEAVAVKYLTQLAFVFTPLTFVTSVFGMKIKEMTDTGPRIWIHILTSVGVASATLITVLLRVYKVPGKGSEAIMKSYTCGRRLLWLYIGLRLALARWMMKEGVLLGLMTNGRFGDQEPGRSIVSQLDQHEGHHSWRVLQELNKSPISHLLEVVTPGIYDRDGHEIVTRSTPWKKWWARWVRCQPVRPDERLDMMTVSIWSY